MMSCSKKWFLLACASVLIFASSAVAQPPVATDLGEITSDQTQSTTIGINEVAWYTFTIPGPAQAGSGYFDITSNGSSVDTEIGLYDAAGNFVVTDDDDGIGLTSTLTFGDGSGLMLGDSFNLGGNGLAEGEDGNLPAGQYYLAVGEYNVTFNPTNWDVISDGTDTGGDIEIAFYAAGVPVELQSFSIE